ncbi:baseplate J/gp47 family protein [Konateibacter massiliensis]|uniref:baseplate J/gp47 family protein n=1 Tax=Konateibacter massiliensis TaxID=2002841 RepID=UPI000C1504EF|nr:baseplate J/gp47 family protein [Konateibacter massiliensis]
MFEEKTYEALLEEKLSNVEKKYDKREGSIIYDALAPNSAEMAMMYIQLEWMFQQMFGDTADREYLIKIAKDTRGLEPFPATNAVLKGNFNCAVPIGSRFSLEKLNYVVTEVMDNTEHTYMLKCETPGIEGNKHFGTMIPIQYISGLTTCELSDILIPGEDEEETETFRKRWRASFDATAFGGNRADYTEKIKAIPGVGGCKCYRATNEAGELVGGHVKCVIIASDYTVPSLELIEKVQGEIDPTQDMEGYGLAPVGHVAHIQAVSGEIINIDCTIIYEDGYSFEDIKSQIEAAVDNYFFTLLQAWEGSPSLVVSIRRIEAAILDVNGVQDIADTKLNGAAGSVTLGVDTIPVRGEIIG